MIHVISLLGRAGHGKTTVANHLKEKYGVKIVSLAAPLKKIAKVVMNFDDAQLYGTQAEKEAIDPRYGMSARLFLQKLGTEGIRTHLGGDVWLQALVHNVIETNKASGGIDTVFVVDDARFINEIEFLRNLPNNLRTTVLKIVCTDAPAAGNASHQSEREIDIVLPSMIDACVISSRTQGMAHLIEGVENALDGGPLKSVRAALQARRRAAEEARRTGDSEAVVVEPAWFDKTEPGRAEPAAS